MVFEIVDVVGFPIFEVRRHSWVGDEIFAVGRADSVDRKIRKHSNAYAKKKARKQAKVDAERAAKRARAEGGSSEGAAATERRL